MRLTGLREVWMLLKGIPFIPWDGRRDLKNRFFEYLDSAKQSLPGELHIKYDNFLDYLRTTYFNYRCEYYNPSRWSHAEYADEGQTVFSTNPIEGLNRSYNSTRKNCGRIKMVNVLNNLGQFKMKEMERKNNALKSNWSNVRKRPKIVRERFTAIIEIVQSFMSMTEEEQTENLILYLEKISKKNKDISAQHQNQDFTST